MADGFGDVYASSPSSAVITKYDLRGNQLQAFDLGVVDPRQFAIDLAPDECTIYDSAWSPMVTGPFNVCTNTQESTTSFGPTDDLRVLPNWQVVRLFDYGAELFDTPASSGQETHVYEPGPPPAYNDGLFRHLSLDPDGSSFWMCCAAKHGEFVSEIFRFDIGTGQILAEWPAAWGSFAVYGPPLLGSANVASTVDSDSPGTAEAFLVHARYSGQVTRLHLYIDSSSTASQVLVGVYSSRHGHPASLQEQRTLTSPRAGSWNYVDLPAMPITAGTRYWVALLGPRGGGTVAFRDKVGVGISLTSKRHRLTTLPARWSTGAVYASGRLSGYGT